MKVALIGASGFVGSQVLREALRRGHQVTAIVRHPEKITLTHPNLQVKKGDAQNEEEVAALVAGHNAVVSTYNPGWDNPDIYNEFLKGAKAIENGTKKAGVKRLIVVGGAGSLYAAPGLQLVDTPEFPAEWKQGALAARDYLDIIRKNESLDWTFLSPAIMLHPGKRTGNYRLEKDKPVFNENGKSEISVEDLSIALMDELEQNRFIRQRFTIGY